MATYIDDFHGYEFTDEGVLEDVNNSIKELESLLAQAKEFKTKLEAGTVGADDTYLSFMGPNENGYDRTGPFWVTLQGE